MTFSGSKQIPFYKNNSVLLFIASFYVSVKKCLVTGGCIMY
jgi:hypothetical protein